MKYNNLRTGIFLASSNALILQYKKRIPLHGRKALDAVLDQKLLDDSCSQVQKHDLVQGQAALLLRILRPRFQRELTRLHHRQQPSKAVVWQHGRLHLKMVAFV